MGNVVQVKEGCPENWACLDTASVINLVKYLEEVRFYLKQADTLCGKETNGEQ